MSNPGDVIEDVRDEAAPLRAHRQAQVAADAAGVSIVELDGIDELRDAAELLHTVWGSVPGRVPVLPDLLRALGHAGSYVAGVYVGPDLVGASMAFLAGGPVDLRLHSHITGVLPGSQRHGVGLAFKLHQRAWAIERGIDVVSWTFDPLVRRNAYFNLTKLAAAVDRFHVNFYGTMADRLNAGEESDRCEVTWDLRSERVVAAADGRVASPDLDDLRRRGAVVVLDDVDGRPRSTPVTGGLRLVRVPDDIVAMRATDPSGARDWRLALRDTFGASLADGFVATGATKDGWYVLEPSP